MAYFPAWWDETEHENSDWSSTTITASTMQRQYEEEASGSFESTPYNELNESPTLWENVKVYWLEVLLGMILCGITVFRREMSCNHVYNNNHKTTNNDRRNEEEKEEADLQRRAQWLAFEVDLDQFAFHVPLSCLPYMPALVASVSKMGWDACGSCMSSFLYYNTTWRGGTATSKQATNTATVHAQHDNVREGQQHNQAAVPATKHESSTTSCMSSDAPCMPLLQMPQDMLQHCLLFLPVRDVVSLAQTSHTAQALIHPCSTSTSTSKLPPSAAATLWHALCLRDFGDVMRWGVAQQRYRHAMDHAAKQQQYQNNQSQLQSKDSSMEGHVHAWHAQWNHHAHSSSHAPSVKGVLPPLPSSTSPPNTHPIPPPRISDMYFILQETWLPWSIAMRNRSPPSTTAISSSLSPAETPSQSSSSSSSSPQTCLVGLHGAIYNLSTFLPHHPGSVETLLIHAGTDATSWFEHVRHSKSARGFAGELCVFMPRVTRRRLEGVMQQHKEEEEEEGGGRLSELSSLLLLQQDDGQTQTPSQSQLQAQAHPRAHSQTQSQNTTTTNNNNKNNTSNKPSCPHHLQQTLSHHQQWYQDLAHQYILQRQVLPPPFVSDASTGAFGALGTLQQQQEELGLERAPMVVGETIHVLYDVFVGRWCAWYTTLTVEEGEMEPFMVFF